MYRIAESPHYYPDDLTDKGDLNMAIQLHDLQCRPIHAEDESALLTYLQHLSSESRSRFGPHPFDAPTVRSICQRQHNDWLTFVAVDPRGQIAAYVVVKIGYLGFEEARYRGYGLKLDHQRDYTLAPSVADEWQSKGLGDRILRYVVARLRERGADKIVLWGGVQARNCRARRFYQKHGFRYLGDFEHHGVNHDMVLQLNDRLMAEPDWLKDLILYEINPYAYTSQWCMGEEQPESGTLALLTERLDYIKRLGVTGIWLAGFSDSSPHHFKGITPVYACRRPDVIDPRLGNREDLEHFVKRCHDLGLRVLLEVVTHGVVHDSSLCAEHPDWFKGSSWGMADYDYQHPGFRAWWIDTWVNYALQLDVDGFRLDGPNGVQTDDEVLQIWDEIIERCGSSNKAILVMPENRGYHLQQGLQDHPYTGNPLAEFSDFPRFRCKAISNHDRNIDTPLQEGPSPYQLQGSRYLLGYEYLFGFNIPLLMSGEEFNAAYRPLPNCQLGLYGGEGPCSWLYASWLDWSQLEEPRHQEMLADFCRLTAIRHRNSDLLHYDRLRTHACLIPYQSDRPKTPYPYLRYHPKGDAILVVGNNSRNLPLTVTLRLPLELLACNNVGRWQLADLWSDELIEASSEELASWSLTVAPDGQSGGGVRILRIRAI